MACERAATGSQTSHYWVLETDCGVTPTSPVWAPIRYTSGNLQLTKDSIQSAELDGSREIADIRLGQNQVAGDISIELSYSSFNFMFKGALGNEWEVTADLTNMEIDVDPAFNRFVRTSGSFVTDGVKVGQFIQFNGLANAENMGVFLVTAVQTLAVNVEDAAGVLISETNVPSVGAEVSDTLTIDTNRYTYSIMTHYADADGGAGEYHIATGCEITGFSLDVSVNAMVTGTFSVIGQDLQVDVAEPAGSTYTAVGTTETFSSLDGKIFKDETVLGYVTSFSLTQDNEQAAQFAIGSDFASFIEKGRCNNTLSVSTFFLDSTLMNLFKDETEVRLNITLMGADGNYNFEFPRCVFTTGAIEVGGPGSITQTLDAQALNPIGTAKTSIVIHRLV
jgi:hypothetical protein